MKGKRKNFEISNKVRKEIRALAEYDEKRPAIEKA